MHHWRHMFITYSTDAMTSDWMTSYIQLNTKTIACWRHSSDIASFFIFLKANWSHKNAVGGQFLGGFFHSKKGTGPETVRIFLRKQQVILINRGGGVLNPKEHVAGKGLFYWLYRTRKFAPSHWLLELILALVNLKLNFFCLVSISLLIYNVVALVFNYWRHIRIFFIWRQSFQPTLLHDIIFLNSALLCSFDPSFPSYPLPLRFPHLS